MVTVVLLFLAFTVPFKVALLVPTGEAASVVTAGPGPVVKVMSAP